MAKLLKAFKNKVLNGVLKHEVLEVESVESTAPMVISNDTSSLGMPSVKLLDQLEKVGYTAIASKLRELQAIQGLDQLDPMMERITKIEEHIDLLLNSPEIDAQGLQRLLKMALEAYQARAKALLLPYGTVSPRTALQGNRGPNRAVNVAIGIGTGVSPRPKTG